MASSFYDLNLANPALEKRALELGFAYAKPVKTIALANARDLKQLDKRACSVDSKSTDLLRAAARQDYELLLVNPYSTPRFFKDDGLVRVLKEASEEKACAFELPIKYFLDTKFVYRARLVSQTRSFLRLCLKMRAPFIFTSRAQSEWNLKSPREVIAIGVFYGLSYEQAAYAISFRAKTLLEGIRVDFSD